MSDGAFDPSGGRLPLDELPAAGGFRSDARFARIAEQPQASSESEMQFAPQTEDPLALAYADGFNAGVAQAQARSAERAEADAAAHEGLAVSFARLDETLEEELRQRLRDTVAALCEAAIAPLVLDEDALMARIERAVALLARADDERLIRLHPDDVALLSPRFAADWQVLPDRSLERGALRIETPNGGVEDGPELWRRAIAEALHQC